MTKLSRIELITTFNTTNLRPVYDFFAETNVFDMQTRILNIEPKEAKKQYKEWKKAKAKKRELIMMLAGKKGRPKKVKETVA